MPQVTLDGSFQRFLTSFGRASMAERSRRSRTHALFAIGVAALLSAGVQSLAQTTQPARVQGEGYDSISHRPLDGALVQLAELPPGRSIYTATTDSTGRFQIDSAHAGNYL